MEIRKVVNCTVPFREITTGDVFLFSEKYYMRMEEFRNRVNDCVNAVNLSSGGVTHFVDDEIVSPIDTCYLAVE